MRPLIALGLVGALLALGAVPQRTLLGRALDVCGLAAPASETLVALPGARPVLAAPTQVAAPGRHPAIRHDLADPPGLTGALQRCATPLRPRPRWTYPPPRAHADDPVPILDSPGVDLFTA